MIKNPDLRELVATYETNECNNAHCDNLVLLATNFGSEEDLALAKTFKEKFDAGVRRSPSEREEFDSLTERLWKTPPPEFFDLYSKEDDDPGDFRYIQMI